MAFIESQLMFTPEDRLESQERIKMLGYALEECNIEFSRLISQALGERMNDFSIPHLAAVAAGDDEGFKNPIKGVWTSGLYGTNSKKSTLNKAGYKGILSGGNIGIDFVIGENENTVIGIAYSNLYSRFKFTNLKSGDKINVKSNVFSLYGQTILYNLILQASASTINNRITNKSLKLVGQDNYKTATGKSKSRGCNFETTAGYNIITDNNITIIPNIGLKYGINHDGEYSETGTGVYNTSIGSNSNSSLVSLVGIKLKTTKYLNNNSSITPVVHASIENVLSHKHGNSVVKLKWADREFADNKREKIEKIGYNIGASLLFHRKSFDILASYNCHLKKRYVSHQSALKIRANF